MHVSEEERQTLHQEPENPEQKPNQPVLIGIAVIALILTALSVYHFIQPAEQGAAAKNTLLLETSPPEQAPSPPPLEIPVREVSEPEFSLPTLDLSDPDFRERLINLSTDMAPWLQTEELIRRSISFTDGLTRGELLTKLVSIPPPEGKFIATKKGKQLFIDEENFVRYQYLTEIIASINPEALTNLFDLYRPLLEQAYGELGYKPETLGSKVIEALDQILGVPISYSPVELKHESVYYTFANPELENLSALQKQLIRMGPKATSVVQEKAKAFKDYLLITPAEAEKTQ